MTGLRLSCRAALLLLSAALLACDQKLPIEPLPDDRAVGAPLLMAAENGLADRYIVVLRPGRTDPADLAVALLGRSGEAPIRTFGSVLRGFEARIPADRLSGLRAHPEVEYVEQVVQLPPEAFGPVEDGSVATKAGDGFTLAGPGSPVGTVQAGAPWGLDRIDQDALPLSGTFTYTRDGAGVNIYIIGPGITSHPDFAGRYVGALSLFKDGTFSPNDCWGQGTAAAGIAAGTTYGVAKGATVRYVRYHGCVDGPLSSELVFAIGHLVDNLETPAVAVLGPELMGTASVRTAVTNAVAAGWFYAVGAGDGNVDACANAVPTALTVGATTSADERASFSAFGSCIDVFAPGAAIAAPVDGSTIGTGSATRYAAAHAAGVAAMLMQADPDATPADIRALIMSSATTGALGNLGTGSADRLLYVAPPPVAPSAPTVSMASPTHVLFSWTDNSTTETGFDVQRRIPGEGWIDLAGRPANTTEVNDVVAANTTYEYRVRSCNADGCSPWATSAAILTPPAVPGSLTVSLTEDRHIQATWTDVSGAVHFQLQRSTGEASETWQTLLEQASLAYDDPGGEPGNFYRYRVAACNATGCSGYRVSTPILLPYIHFDPGSIALTFIRAAGSAAAAVPTDSTLIPRFTSSYDGPKAGLATASGGAGPTVATTAERAVRFDNPTADELDWVATMPAPWVTASPMAGLVKTGGTGSLLVTVNAGGLPAGTTTGNIVLADPDRPTSASPLPVEVNVIEATALAHGVAVTNVADTAGGNRYYYIDVPAGALLRVSLAGGTGDADLYVRYGDVPGVTVYDCGSIEYDSDELCTTAAFAGRYYILVNGYGAYSGVTLLATIGGSPTAPSAVQTVANAHDAIGVTWSDDSNNETSFRVQRRADTGGGYGAWQNVVTDLPAGTTSHTSTGLAPLVTYQHRVRACNDDGCSPWATSPHTTTPLAITLTPDTLRFTFVQAGDGVLPAAVPSDSTLIPRFTASGGAPAASTGTAPADAVAASSATKSFEMSNIGAGEMEWEAAATTAWAAPTPAGGLLPSGGRVGVSVSVDASGLPSGVTPGAIEITGPSAPDVPTAQPLAATVYVAGVLTTGVPALVTGTGSRYYTLSLPETGGSLSIGISGGTEDATLYVRYGAVPTATAWDCRPLRIGNEETCATASPRAGTYYVLVIGGADVTLLATMDGVPLSPAPVTAVASGPLEATVAWLDNSANETGFSVQRRVRAPGGSFGAWQLLLAVPAGSTGHVDTGLSPSHDYQYRVRSCNDFGCSAWSPAPHVTMAPAAPGGFTATAPSAGRINLAWTDNAVDETSYELERRVTTTTETGEFLGLAATAADVTAFQDTLVWPTSMYRYRIRACGIGCSDWVESDDVTPPAAAILYISPDSLTFDFVRVGGSPALTTVPLDSTLIPRFTAAGQPKAAASLAGDDSGATASVTTSSSQPLVLVNSGNAPLEWRAEGSAPWVAPAFSQGMVSPGAAAHLAVTVESAALPLGTTSGSVTVSDPAALHSPRSAQVAAHVHTAATLQLGVPVSGLSAASKDRLWFVVEVPENAGTFVVSTTGPVGQDADLYVRYGDVPSTTKYDCRGFSSSANESCSALSRAGTYYVMVHAYSAITNVTLLAALPFSVPPAPTGLSGTPVLVDRIDLAWTDNSAFETGFQVQRRSAPPGGSFGPFADAGAVGADVTTFQDTGLLPGHTYRHRVRSCSAAGCSAWLTATTGTTPLPPTDPSGVSGTPVSGTRIDLAWVDNSADETGFRIERRADLGAGFGDWLTVTTTGSNTVAYVDTGLLSAVTYQYRVSACSALGCSSGATSASITTLLEAPAAPGAVVATAISDAQVDLAWADNSHNETRFQVQRRVFSDGSFGAYQNVATNLPPNSTGFSDTGLAPSTTYQYRVRACNGATVPCSSFVTATAVTTPAATPAAPTDVAAAASSATEATVTWGDASPNETRFEVQRRLRTGDVWGAYESVGGVLAANTTAYGDTGLSPGERYQYRVRACNDVGCSAFISATPVTMPAAEAPLASTTQPRRPAAASTTEPDNGTDR